MPDIATVLKQEITRLAKKELKPVVTSQSKQIQSLKATMRDLGNRIAELEKSLPKIKTTSPLDPQEKEEQKDIRISPTTIKRHRKRLKLSQVDFGKLLGVSTLSVWNWESGRSSPSGSNRENIAELRSMGIRDVEVLLESL